MTAPRAPASGPPARPKLTRAQRAKLFRDFGGVCHICTRAIALGEPWEADHPKPIGLGGDPHDMRPAHVDCHAGKTHREDRPRMAKADRQAKARAGIKTKGRGFRGWRTFSGEIRHADDRRR